MGPIDLLRRASAGLPERVAARLHRQQLLGEHTVTLVHLVFIATVAVLYALAPPQDNTVQPFLMMEPVPLALSAFLVWSLLRLVLWRLDRLGPSVVAISIVVEMGFLMALLWSLHVQYGAGPAFSLKAPTAACAFLFICTRALGLAAWAVVASGVAAVVGWLGLVLYALADPRTQVTRSFRQYITSSDLLIGAEIEKMAYLVAVTAVLTLVLMRYRSALVHAANTERAVEDFSRFFDPLVARRIVEDEQAVRQNSGEIRVGSVAFFDLRDFTGISTRLGPTDLLRLLAEYQSLVMPLVERHGGRIDKFIGDGIMVTFGLMSPQGDHARAAVRTACAVLEAGQRWRDTRQTLGLAAPSLCCGIASGEMLFGTIDHGGRLEVTVIGEVVNRAAKLEKMTRDLGSALLVDEATAAAVTAFQAAAGEAAVGAAALGQAGSVPLHGATAPPARGHGPALPAGDNGPALPVGDNGPALPAGDDAPALPVLVQMATVPRLGAIWGLAAAAGGAPGRPASAAGLGAGRGADLEATGGVAAGLATGPGGPRSAGAAPGVALGHDKLL